MTRFALVLPLLLLPLAAQASTKTVEAGATTRITTLGSLNGLCRTGATNPRVTTSPAHGTLDLRHEMLTWKGGTMACEGVVYPGTAAYYTPAHGYHGPDHAVFTVDLYNGRTYVPRDYDVDITVR